MGRVGEMSGRMDGWMDGWTTVISSNDPWCDLEPSRAAPGKTGGMMPQTRPRGLTGSVTTGRTADIHTHTRTLSLSHCLQSLPPSLSLSLSHTHNQSEFGCVGGRGCLVRKCGREAW